MDAGAFRPPWNISPARYAPNAATSTSSGRAGRERGPPGLLRVHRRSIDVDSADPSGTGDAVRHRVDASGRVLGRSGSAEPVRVDTDAELSLRGMGQLRLRADGRTRRAAAGDGAAAAHIRARDPG